MQCIYIYKYLQTHTHINSLTHTHTMCVAHNPSADILHIWNKLPNYIRNVQNTHIFTMMIFYIICHMYFIQYTYLI